MASEFKPLFPTHKSIECRKSIKCGTGGSHQKMPTMGLTTGTVAVPSEIVFLVNLSLTVMTIIKTFIQWSILNHLQLLLISKPYSQLFNQLRNQLFLFIIIDQPATNLIRRHPYFCPGGNIRSHAFGPCAHHSS